ncbi:MAG TPA: cytochrome c peroxidase [Kofleriaceae bacterium]|nr:cytochrome c peroxidase [Kofleriaceae bacterium]
MRKLPSLVLVVVAACGDGTPAPATDASPPPDVREPDAASPTEDDFTAEELAILATLSPLPAVPADPTNAFADDPKAAALGQMLFFDKSYSGALIVGDDGTNGGLGMVGETGKVACASCHSAGSANLDDQRTIPNHVSLGTNYTPRNAHGLVNSAFYRWGNWGGRFDSQWALPLAVAENANLMRSTRLDIAHMLFRKYRAQYDATFPVPLDPALDPNAADASRFPPSGKPKALATDPDGAFEAMTVEDRAIANRIFVNYGKAIAAYTRTLVSRDAAFDRYVAGDRTAISTSAKRGLHLFLAHCTGCHTGPNLADDEFHALAVPQRGDHVPATDLGRFQDVPGLLASPFNTAGAFSDDTTTGKLDGLVQADAQKGQFRTKSLRGVAQSAPYMHAGQLATLADVVAFYNAGGGDPGTTGIVKDPKLAPLGLTAEQQADLVAFLQTLTGEPVPAMRVTDTSK